MPAPPRIRPAVRAVVTDPAHRILLVHFSFPTDETLPAGLWACPGGGIDPGESKTEALKRELVEELGLEVSDPGQPIWHRERVFPMERWDGQRDTFYWVQVQPFEARPQLSPEQLLAENVDTMRWWTLDEVLAAQRAFDAGDRDDPSYAVLSPRALGHLVRDLLKNGRPPETLILDPL